jgi:hypothetical protein
MKDISAFAISVLITAGLIHLITGRPGNIYLTVLGVFIGYLSSRYVLPKFKRSKKSHQ